MNKQYKLLTGLDYKGQYDLQQEIVWPEFMYHDLVSIRYWKVLFDSFPEFQFTIFHDENPLGYANSIPLSIDVDNLQLDDRGWDWALEKGIKDKTEGKVLTALCGLQIGLNEQSKGQGISYKLIDGMREIAKNHNFKALVLPIRPSLKAKYSLIEMEDYITWKNDAGLPFDPWIRAHTKCGAKIISVCNQAMYIAGTIQEWHEWTGLEMKTSGSYIVDGALVPVRANVENNIAEYIEPNVWMIHYL